MLFTFDSRYDILYKQNSINEVLYMFGKGRHRPYYTKEGYKQIYKPNSPEARDDGYAAEHRVVASKKIGRPLRDNEVVHHRDGNK